MANITAAEIGKLRSQTGAGMMDCRKALIESDGDFEKAIEYLRKKGQKVAAVRGGRETKEGVVIAQTNPEETKGILLSLNCETDFVAMNEDFINFAKSVTNLALEKGLNSIEEINAAKLDGTEVSQHLIEMIGKIGEN